MTKAPIDLEQLKAEWDIYNSVSVNLGPDFWERQGEARRVLTKAVPDLIELLEQAKKLAIKCDDYGCRYETDWFEWLNRFYKKEGEK